jgi:hypothetical protein
MSTFTDKLREIKDNFSIGMTIWYIILLALLVVFPITMVSNHENNPDWVNVIGYIGVGFWGAGFFIQSIIYLSNRK